MRTSVNLSPRADAAHVPARRASTATESRQFPAGSYVVRMDQPYSRIADALLDYQFWSLNDPQKTPYDDTGWTFPENFNVHALRVVDPAVLETPMERVTGAIKPVGGVEGEGGTFVINNNADNALMTLRYAFGARTSRQPRSRSSWAVAHSHVAHTSCEAYQGTIWIEPRANSASP